jgi:hypothetical protein
MATTETCNLAVANKVGCHWSLDKFNWRMQAVGTGLWNRPVIAKGHDQTSLPLLEGVDKPEKNGRWPW